MARLRRAGGFLFLFLDDDVLAGGFLALAARLGLGLKPVRLLLLTLDRLLVLFRALVVRDYSGLGVQLCFLALLGLAVPRFLKGLEARVLLVLREGAQHHARAALLGFLAFAGRIALRRGRRHLWLGLLNRQSRRRGAYCPTLFLLHQNGLGAPMAEALANMAGFDRPAHIERHLPGTANGLVVSFVNLAHSLSMFDPVGCETAVLPLR